MRCAPPVVNRVGPKPIFPTEDGLPKVPSVGVTIAHMRLQPGARLGAYQSFGWILGNRCISNCNSLIRNRLAEIPARPEKGSTAAYDCMVPLGHTQGCAGSRTLGKPC